jgi:hypothetical protein
MRLRLRSLKKAMALPHHRGRWIEEIIATDLPADDAKCVSQTKPMKELYYYKGGALVSPGSFRCQSPCE